MTFAVEVEVGHQGVRAWRHADGRGSILSGRQRAAVGHNLRGHGAEQVHQQVQRRMGCGPDGFTNGHRSPRRAGIDERADVSEPRLRHDFAQQSHQRLETPRKGHADSTRRP